MPPHRCRNPGGLQHTKTMPKLIRRSASAVPSYFTKRTSSLPYLDTRATRSDRHIMAGSRQLPMPIVTRVTSLSQAHATLQHCWVKLSSFVQDYPASGSTTSSSSSDGAAVTMERQRFQTWLEQWEVAFTGFLTVAMAAMYGDDITQSRILKTNHLACTILAADNETTFDNEFNAIVELAGAVLRSRSTGSPSPESNIGGPLTWPPTFTAATLDVLDPLMVVISRCDIDVVRMRAAELLRSRNR